MKFLNSTIFALALAFFNPAALAEVDKAKIEISPNDIYRFTISLLELREDTQHKHLSKEEIVELARVFESAKFEKKMEYLDGVRTPYISRYQFSFQYRRGTPKGDKSGNGMLTIDAQTLYWEESIYTLDKSGAERLLKIFPTPVNPRTVSERPEAEIDERKQNKAGDGNSK